MSWSTSGRSFPFSFLPVSYDLHRIRDGTLVDEELELALIREARCESVLANQALRALMRYPVEDYFDVVPELLDCADRENAWAAKQVVEWARMCCPDIERLRDRKTRLEEVAEVKACLRESRISAVNPFVKPPPRRLMCQEKRDRELEERRRQAEERRKRMAPR